MSQLPNALPRLPRQQADAGTTTLEHVREALRGLQHGELTVVVQDGVVVQLRRTDRVRLPAVGPGSPQPEG